MAERQRPPYIDETYWNDIDDDQKDIFLMVEYQLARRIIAQEHLEEMKALGDDPKISEVFNSLKKRVCRLEALRTQYPTIADDI